jgi:hypothetical protein
MWDVITLLQIKTGTEERRCCCGYCIPHSFAAFSATCTAICLAFSPWLLSSSLSAPICSNT